MPDINKVLCKVDKSVVKKWMANKIKASRLRREVRTLGKLKRAIEKKLSKKVAKVEELTTLIHADDHHVRVIRARRHISHYGLIEWFMRRFGPPPRPEDRVRNPASDPSGSDAGSDVGSASSDASIWASSDASDKMGC